jgi:hypothetical protein
MPAVTQAPPLTEEQIFRAACPRDIPTIGGMTGGEATATPEGE